MASITEKIQTLLSKSKKAREHQVKFYAESRLNDGRVVVTEEEAMVVGAPVKVLEEDGIAYPLDGGAYILEDGTELIIDDMGFIERIGEEEATEEVVEEEVLAEDDGQEADVGDWAGMEKRIQNLEDAIADLKSDKVEASVETKTEMSTDIIGELLTKVDSMESKMTELEESPASNGVEINPTGQTKQTFNSVSKKDFLKMTTADRAKFMIKNKLTQI
tara:strand:+ start:2256 stop:2909 length:654 start_codon:yes stop_codon:yes gene_type:complete